MSIYDKSSLVLIPSGTKTGKVYSQKPVSGDGDFTFTRSSAATRVNASGNIEKETQNLLVQSNSFDTTWGNTNITITGGQGDRDGGSNAWKFDINAGTAAQNVRQSVSNSGVTTFSIYLKAGTLNWSLVQVLDGGSNPAAYFDLQNGAIGNITGGAIDASIEAAGNGFYRCSIQAYGSINQARIYTATADNNITQSSGYIFGQDAQIEQGLVARDYIETTTTAVEGGITDNVPRLDYTDSSCPALLLEPQRTNLFTNSEYTGGYGNFGSTDTPNNASSPEGVQNAVLLEGDGTQPQVFFSTPNLTLSSAGSYTISVFAKKGTSNYMQISLDGFTGAGNGSGYFDLENGTTTYSGASIEDYGNDWYRCILVVTIDAGDLIGRIAIRVTPSTSGFLWSSSSEANGKNIYMYGFQMEAGSYETSYIPTYGSSVTRVNETCGTSSNASTFNSTEGVLYFEGSALSNDLTFKRICIGTSDTLFENNVGLRFDNNGVSVTYQFRSGNVYQAELTTTINQADVNKLACVWKENRFELWKNGVKIAQDTSGSVPPANTFDAVFYGKTSTLTESLYGKTKQILVFKTALSDEELAALTTI